MFFYSPICRCSSYFLLRTSSLNLKDFMVTGRYVSNLMHLILILWSEVKPVNSPFFFFQGIKSRVYETIAILLLLFIFVGGITYLTSSLINGSRTSGIFPLLSNYPPSTACD